MIRTLITILSLSFATAWFLWSQLHWYHLEARNDQLQKRVDFFITTCKETIQENEKLNNKNKHLEQRVYVFEQKRKKKKYLVELTKLLKARNLTFGIGGN